MLGVLTMLGALTAFSPPGVTGHYGSQRLEQLSRSLP
jgi:hypothetical protein